MGALYKGLIVTGLLSLVGVALVTWWLVGFGTVPGQTYSGTALFLCGIAGLAVTGLIVWITEYYTGTDYPPGAVDRQGLGHRPRHQHHPGSCGIAGVRPRCRRS